MLIENLFIPVGAALQMTAADFTPEGIRVDLHTTTQTADCPTCAVTTHQVHSHYQRRLADLPLAQLPVRIHLHVRRFRGATLGCGRTTFTEPVPGLAIPSARRTTRLRAEQRQLALDVGGEPGARLARRQGMGPHRLSLSYGVICTQIANLSLSGGVRGTQTRRRPADGRRCGSGSAMRRPA
ncbi:transposase family protein [Candidatus Chloroploca asiatica]|uniref:transposase family protein n=1 Tax=Candidatus Chloroploca asiatica TaxID=1506545 RepID=UPI000BE8B8DE